MRGTLFTIFLAIPVLVVHGDQRIVSAHLKSTGYKHKPPSKQRTVSSDLNVTFYADGGAYLVSVSIGTPPQTVYLSLDTLTADTWIQGEVLCANTPFLCDGGYFNTTKSSTYQSHGTDNFQLHYVEDVGIGNGSYFLDTISIGNLHVKNQQMGLAIADDEGLDFGSLGLGQPYSQVSNRLDGVTYPSLLDQMVQQDLIHRRVFSIYTGDIINEEGSLVFGGIDTEKYTGDIVYLPVQTIYNQGKNPYGWDLIFSSFSTHNATNDHHLTLPENSQIELSSYNTFIYLPSNIITEVAKGVDVYQSPEHQFWEINCSHSQDQTTYLSFGLGTKESGIAVVNISLSALVLQIYDDVGRPLYCAFGLQNHVDNEVGNPEPNKYVFGTIFMEFAYLIFDLDAQTVGVAQAILNANDSNIQELLPSTTTTPTTAVTPSPSTTIQTSETADTTASAVVTATIRNSARSMYRCPWYCLFCTLVIILLMYI